MSVETVTIPERQLAISYSVDVVVIGGGPAGVAAAIASARNGAKTMLIEQRGFLGGMGTVALVPAFCPYTDGEKPIIRGIGLELLERMKVHAGKSFLQQYKEQLDWVPIDAEALKRVYDEAVIESGVIPLYHTFVSQVLMDGSDIAGVVIVNKTGTSVVKARTYIDTTGDADIAAMAGVPFHKGGEKGELQPGTMCYLLAGADHLRFKEYLRLSGDTEQIPLAVQKAQSDGELPVGRKEVSGFAWISSSVVGVNFGHIFGIDGTKAEELTRGAIEGRRLVERQVQFLRKYVPGFKEAHLVQTGEQVGIRETRRIEGEYVLTVDDFLQMRSFEDDIARNSYFIDIHLANSKSNMTIRHLAKGRSHGVPYRCLLPKRVNNLVVAGRSASSDRIVQGSLRVMPNCFAMGQAAGTACAIVMKENSSLRKVSISLLQETLVTQGAWLGEEEK